jgi:predicted transposase YdaD
LAKQLAEQLAEQRVEQRVEQGVEKRTVEIASNLLALGLPIEIIKESTKLDEKTILSLKKKMNKPD